MADITLRGNFGLIIEANADLGSAWKKYLRKPISIEGVLQNVKPLNELQIGQDPFTSKKLGLSFRQSLELGNSGAELSIQPQTSASVEIFKPPALFDSDGDDFCESVPIPKQDAYVSATLLATVNTAVSTAVDRLSFCFGSSATLTLSNYRLFALSDQIVPAVKTLFQDFFIPATIEDIRTMPENSIATIAGDGSLKFSAVANLLTLVNPLASLSVPVVDSALRLNHDASLAVSAHYQLSGGIQLRIHRLAQDKFIFGVLKKRGSDAGISVSARLGLSADLEGFEVIERILTLVSPDPVPDKGTFERAGLNDTQVAVIAAAVKQGVERCLQLSLASEIDLREEVSTAFSYEVDFEALTLQSTQALQQAFWGDLTAIEAGSLPGITPLTSIFTESQKRSSSLKINLLGIFNYASVSDLFRNGTILVDRSSGQLTVTDNVGAKRIEFTSDNFVKKPDQLRRVLAESLLVTVSYRASQSVYAAPSFSSKLWFFDYQRNASLSTLQSYLLVARALKLTTPATDAKVQGLTGKTSLGTAVLDAESAYGSALFESLFLDDARNPRLEREYQMLGRQALAALIAPDSALNLTRLRPLTDDAMWKSMEGGVNTFRTVLVENRAIGLQFLPDIEADYTAIAWWAEAMHDLAVVLSRLLGNPSSAQLRAALDQKLKSVTANTHSHFGSPWGFVVMDLASGLRAQTTLKITSSKLNFVSLPAAAKASGSA